MISRRTRRGLILLALLAREKTGSGQHIDISMTDVIFPDSSKIGVASTKTETSRPSRHLTRSSLRWH